MSVDRITEILEDENTEVLGGLFTISEALSAGTNTFNRLLASSTFNSAGTASLTLVGFTPPKSFVSSGAALSISVAGTLVTGSYVALYEVAANNDLTLIAVTAPVTVPFMSTGYVQIPWTAPVAIQAGQRYAVGPLINFTGTYPTVASTPFMNINGAPGDTLVTGYFLAAVPPATIAAGAMTFFSPAIYVEVTV